MITPLSPRELQVLSLMADGMQGHIAAFRLGIGTETVKSHTSNIRQKLGAKNLAHAVAIAMRNRVIP